VPIDAVIFDVGGVLETTPRTGWEARWCSRLELPREDFEARLAPVFAAGAIGTMTLAEVERGIAGALDLGDSELIQFMDEVWDEYLGTLNEPLARYFSRLRPRYRTGILSNSFVGAREHEQMRYGLANLCDVIVYSHEEGLLKPDHRFYRLVCDRLGVQPEGCVFVDDTPGHVAAARDLGMRAVTFVDTEQATRELDELLDR
jgi:epoxide hydrolase-like predicted phosphatase